MMERLGVKDAEAIQQEIERFDAGHSRAMRAAFNFDWNNALHTSADNSLDASFGRRRRHCAQEPWTCRSSEGLEHRADACAQPRLSTLDTRLDRGLVS
jgi:hypothetical protein